LKFLVAKSKPVRFKGKAFIGLSPPMQKFLYCLFFVFIASMVATTSFDASAKGKKLTPKQMHEELNITLELLSNQHPNFGFYRSKVRVRNSFKRATGEIIKPLGRDEFFKRLMPLIAQIGDAHTCLDIPEKIVKKYFKLNPKVLPMLLTIHPRYAVVAKNYKGLKAGEKVTSIDGRSIKKMLIELSDFVCRDGDNKSSILHQLNAGFPWYYYIAFGESAKHELVVERSEGGLGILSFEASRLSSILPAFTRRSTQSKNFMKTKWLKALHTYYIDLNSFMPTKERFQQRVSKAFRDIAKKKPEHLILDLRGNEGGLTDNAAHLLRYLVKQPFYFPRFYHLPKEQLKASTKIRNVTPSPNGKETHIDVANALISLVSGWMGNSKAIPGGNVLINNDTARRQDAFEGRIHVLIDGGTASAASMLAAHLRTHGEATFYGGVAGGIPGRNCSAPSHAYILPHSKFELHVAWLCHLEKVTKKFSTFKPDVLFVDKKANSFKKDRLLAVVKKKIEVLSYPPIPQPKPRSIRFFEYHYTN
jgi:hypothetical protein